MKKNIIWIVTLMLSMVTLTSCEDLLDELWDFHCHGAESISGPWLQDGYEITYLGGGEYEVWDAGRQRGHYEYLSSFGSYVSCIPENAWPVSYKPYYNTFYDELSWYVYDRYGRDFLILKNGNYVYM